jgi:acyl-coenzyme A thioesterase PaaI-like protein
MSVQTPGDRSATPTGYPPPRHVVRDLLFELEDTGPDAARAHLPIRPELCRDGRLDPGPLLVVTDVLAGLLVGRVIAPDWMATAQLALHLVDPPGADGPDRTDVVVDASVRRAGRTTIVVEADLSAAGAGGDARRSIGEAELTFARLPRRDGNLDIGDTPVAYGQRFSMALPDSGLTGSFRDAVGSRIVAGTEGVLELPVVPFVQNSFGAVNGGVVASVAADAAVAIAGPALGGTARVVDLSASYLSQGKVGPLRTTGSVLRIDGPVALVRVEVLDPGLVDDDGSPRVVVIAHVHCVAVSA